MREEILDKISSLILKSQLTESETCHLMVLIRKRLEYMNKAERKKYALLKFFCDWSVHVKIEYSSVAYEIILGLNNALFDVKDLKDTNLVIQKVSNVISFPRLQAKIKTFFEKFNLPCDLVDDFNNWRNFVINLINIISDCPLVLPDRPQNKRVCKTRRQMLKKSMKKDSVISQLKLSWIDQKIFRPEILHQKPENIKKDSFKALILHILMSNTTSILMPYLVTWEINKVNENRARKK